MKHASMISILVFALFFLTVSSSLAPAASPTVSKSILSSDENSTVILIKVSAAGRDIYGVDVSDPSGSIEDVVAPKGWCSIATDEQASFRTTNKPIRKGSSLFLRIVTKDKNVKFNITFKDSKTFFDGKKNI